VLICLIKCAQSAWTAQAQGSADLGVLDTTQSFLHEHAYGTCKL
jgi:hypothetical protein